MEEAELLLARDGKKVEGLGFRVQHLKSKHSFKEQLFQVPEEYPPAHWVP